jgi:lipopolysaccharide export system protein LptA
MTGQPAPASRRRRAVRAAAVAALLLLAGLAARGLFTPRPRAAGGTAVADDRDISYLAFNEENKKSIEIRCRETIASGENEVQLKGISGVIFKRGRMNQDIRFFSERGIAKDDFNHFQILGRARIVSDEFTVSAESFLMTHQQTLVANGPTVFSGKSVSGRAAEGIEFRFDLDEYKFFAVAGTVARDGRAFAFASRMLWMFKAQDRLELKGQSRLSGADSTVSGDEIIMRFADGLSDLRSYVSLGNSRLRSQRAIAGAAPGQNEVMEIAARSIESLFAAGGGLERLMVFDQGQLQVAGPGGRCELSGDNIDCLMFPDRQTLREVFVRTPGKIRSRGAQDLEFSAGQIGLAYGETGELQRLHGEDGVRFSLGDFRGSAPELTLDAPKRALFLSGAGAEIRSGGHLFAGPAFVIDTRKNQLSAPKGVQATLALGKGNVLFRPAPVYLVADEVRASDRGRDIAFKGKARLFQDETKLEAAEIRLHTGRKQVVAQGRVRLQFADQKSSIVLQGGTVSFDSGQRRIVTQGDGQLEQGDNVLKAGTITLALAADDRLQTIAAQGDVVFANERISGRSTLLDWAFAQNVMVFKGDAQIGRKNSGTTRGQELRFDMASGEIAVSGADDRSETTIRPDRP